MRRLTLLAVLFFVALCSGSAARAAEPLKVCLVSGSKEYKSNESLTEFQPYLENNFNIKCTRAFFDGNRNDDLPGLEKLADCDVVLLFTKRLQLSGEQLERLKSYCLSGKPLVGVRTASHAIQTWLDLDKEVLGGNYKGHYDVGPITEITIPDAAKNHPILEGVKPYRSIASLYKNEGHSADIDVLMKGTIPDHTESLSWTRNYKGGRIFYTSLGHPQDFTEDSFRRMLANALFWTAGRSTERKEQARAESSPAVEIDVQKDVVYGTGGGEDLLLDVASRKGLDKPVAGIIFIHGGAWQAGSKAEFEGQIRDAARKGYVAATINYRLAPKHLFPAQIEDSKCAVRWMRANAEKLHVDPNRIGVVGSSAGAHLAMMLGAMDSGDGLEGEGGWSNVSSKPQAVVSFAGPTNLAGQFPEGSKGLVAKFLGGFAAEKPDAARAASPLSYVNAGDAPMLLFQGMKDPLVPFDQAYSMGEALMRVGVPGRVELLTLAAHGWDPKEHERVMQATYAFLGEKLK